MNSKNTIIEGYLDMVRKKIHKAGNADRFIDFLREDLQDFCDNNPGCTEEDLIREFGKPEDVARNYINDNIKVDPKEVAKCKKKKTALIIVLALILIAILTYTIINIVVYIDYKSGYGVIETEIEEEIIEEDVTG